MQKTIIFLSCIMCFFLSGYAQSINIPDYKLDKPEDFAKYQPDILKCINWLESNPNTVEPEKRKMAEKFILEWIIGTPDVSIEINSAIAKFISSSPDLIVPYFCGGIKYVLNGGDNDDKVKVAIASLESVIRYYELNKPKKDKEVEKIIKLNKSGGLQSWVAKELK